MLRALVSVSGSLLPWSQKLFTFARHPQNSKQLRGPAAKFKKRHWSVSYFILADLQPINQMHSIAANACKYQLSQIHLQNYLWLLENK